ncbi:MAG: glycosyl hydrolase [Verrucomicrobiota bacterium]
MNKLILLILVTLLPLSLLSAAESAPPVPDPLVRGFVSPPDSAKPQTWWHWMNGNITKAGITADLEAMKQIGLGGATIVNVDCGIPAGPVKFMSLEWREHFKFAVQEAHRLGLDLTVENCAGWSSSGGPWNRPENAMQQVVSSEVWVSGPTNFVAALPPPPAKLDFYRDIAVLAYPVSDADSLRMENFSPSASAGGNSPAAGKIVDGDSKTLIRLPTPKPAKPQFAQLEFKQPFAARTVKIVAGAAMPQCSGEVCVSDDGLSFRVVKKFAFGSHNSGVCLVSLGGEPVRARFWRVQFNGLSAGEKDKTATIPVAEIYLEPRASVAELGKKITMEGGVASGQTEVTSDSDAGSNPTGTVQRRDLLDLTSKLTADGKLNWRAPAGKWVVLRLGCTLTGRNNHPAPAEGTGLECDKFSQSALDAHWDGFMQKILDDVGPLAGKTLTTSLIDSYEVGGQNWNKDFRAEFQKRRGYDLLTYLPAMTGRIVDSPARTERFLWDLRRTIADLFAENYFGHFAELCRRHGLLNAVEPYTGPFESLQSGAPADVVMGEFWSGSQGHSSIKLAASIAHIYGKTIVGAESFTASPGPKAGRWQDDPYSLKTLGDLTFAQGLNRYIFHRYAMQPWTNTWPGMTMGQWGFHFERTVTWWHQGKPWIDYISRCEFLLQQGRAVADVAYFNGESAPSEMRLGNPALPAGYDFDAVNADVLLHRSTVKNGRLTLASGANYAALVLPQTDSDLTPPLLERIGKLVRDGATVIGSRPQHSPSLTDFPGCDQRVKQLADALWGKCDGTNLQENVVGKGRVVWGKSLPEVFAAPGLKPDFEFTNASAARLAYCHRLAGDVDIYFVSNQRRQFDSAECTFRVTGRIPELWHPETGAIETAPVWRIQDGRTQVQLNFQPAESVFVIFRRPANHADHVVAVSGSMKTASPVLPKLEIQRAVYAATEDADGMDVTAKLAGLISDGQLVVTVNNGVLGRDPAVNRKKELRVDYTLAGKPGQTIVPENTALTLPETLVASRPPQWETGVAADGSAVVKVWSDGVVTLSTASGKTLQASASGLPAPQEISGAWKLNFPPNWGAPPAIALDKLISWTEHPNDGVRYFSGTAAYEREIEISADRLTAGRELWLDLGAVKNFAEVTLNGQDFGVLWKPPFRVNVTQAAKPGVNKLVVKVTNLWPNRLVGDEQLPDDREWNGKQLKAWPQWFLDGKPSPTGRLTFTTWHHWLKDSPLLESGLLGPVMLQTAQKIVVVQPVRK